MNTLGMISVDTDLSMVSYNLKASEKGMLTAIVCIHTAIKQQHYAVTAH